MVAFSITRGTPKETKSLPARILLLGMNQSNRFSWSKNCCCRVHTLKRPVESVTVFLPCFQVESRNETSCKEIDPASSRKERVRWCIYEKNMVGSRVAFYFGRMHDEIVATLAVRRCRSKLRGWFLSFRQTPAAVQRVFVTI